MNRRKIVELQVMSFLEALRNVGYSEVSIRQYQKTYRSFLFYMEINSIETFSPETKRLYLSTLTDEKVLLRRNSSYRLLMFNKYFSDGVIQKPVVKRIVRDFPGKQEIPCCSSFPHWKKKDWMPVQLMDMSVFSVIFYDTYTCTLKRLARDQRFRNHPKNRKKAVRADRKVKTIAGRLVRELERNRQQLGY